MLQLLLAFYVVFSCALCFFWVICAEQYFWKLLAAGIKHRSFGSLSMGLNPLTFTKKKKKQVCQWHHQPAEMECVWPSSSDEPVVLSVERGIWTRCIRLLSLPQALNQNHRAKTMNIQKFYLHSDWNCSWTNRTFELSAYLKRQLIYVLL